MAEPGLAVIEIANADDTTAFALQEALAARWATAAADRTTREPGVRLRPFILRRRADCTPPEDERQQGPPTYPMV